MKLYRAMKIAADGLPEVGPSARTLGVRGHDHAPDHDVQASDPSDTVQPGTGGLSVAPGDPMFLRKHRRPPVLNGTGKDPIWEIDESDLGPTLRFDQDSPTHGLIGPNQDMTLEEFVQALAATRAQWRRAFD